MTDNLNLYGAFDPGENVTIYKQLKAFRGRCQYGLKFFWATDSVTCFPLKLKL